MLPNEVLNHMTADELRAYTVHVQKLEDAHGMVMFAQGEIIDLLQRLYNAQNYKDEQRIKHDVKLGMVRRYEREMEQKYDEYMPRPTCEERRATHGEKKEAGNHSDQKGR